MGLYVDEQVGSELSTNFRWWIRKIPQTQLRRSDLNHPPTSVGGISLFSHVYNTSDISIRQQ
jgi:hypothetical protein